MFVLIIITVSTSPQRYTRFLYYQNFILFFFVKSAFFCFWLFGGIWSGFIFLRGGLSGFMFPAFYCACLRPVFLLSVSGLVCSVRLFWGLGVYNNYISILKNKSLLVFRFFLAGHLQGHFIGALWRGIMAGHSITGHFRGILGSWGHFLV